MIATSSLQYPSSSPPFGFLPQHPSPLSPRSANIHGPRVSMPITRSHSSGQENTITHAKSDVPFSKRAVKKAPSPKQDDLKERRRKIFLDKVKQGREDRRFESRGEDIMRLDFVRARRNWEASLARDAPPLPSDAPEPDEEDIEDEYDLPTFSSGNSMQISQPSTQPQLPVLKEEEEVDEMAQMEDQELEALLEMMPESFDGSEGNGCGKPQEQNLWSDDGEDYEELFSELMERDDVVASQGQQQGLSQHAEQADGEAMDMS